MEPTPPPPAVPAAVLPDEAYDIVGQVGEGTYGQVYKASGEKSGALVALKRIRMEHAREGFPVTSMREMKLLQSLRHPNVIRLHETMTSRTGSVYMVFEYMEHDLHGILVHPEVQFLESHRKSLASQLLHGLAYLHQRAVLHRDLKCSNLLLNNDGVLKLADFGLARTYSKRHAGDYTNRVVTLWYRPPELLLGATQYGPEIDMWGAGCLFLELFTRRAAFPGRDEVHQMHTITQRLGPLTPAQWPDVVTLPWYELLRLDVDGVPVSSVLPDTPTDTFVQNYGTLLSPGAQAVARGLLAYAPRRRWTAQATLEHAYFVSDAPAPERPAGYVICLLTPDCWPRSAASGTSGSPSARNAPAPRRVRNHVALPWRAGRATAFFPRSSMVTAEHEQQAAAGAAPASQVVIAKMPGGRPDPKAHNEAMDQLKADIDQTHAKIAQIRAALSGEANANTPDGQRRIKLREELEQIRQTQAGRKGSRGKLFDQLKVLQDDIAGKVKTLQAAKAKAPVKSMAELDARIREIEAQIESGAMKIVDERKALNEASNLKKARRTMDQFAEHQAEIDGLRKKADELRESLHDPETVAANQRYDAIKKELDELAQKQERQYGSRTKLQNQRTALSKKLDELYQARRDRLNAYHAENDKYFARVHAERERRQEAQRKERHDTEVARQAQEEQELREEAALPAFAKEIEDCDVLIRYFSHGEVDAAPAAAATAAEAPASSVPARLPPRETDTAVPEGAVVARKKGEEESYFVGSAKKKNKGKKSAAKEAPDATGSLHVPFGMLSALLNLSIPPPTNASELPNVIENLKLKRKYFISNQARQTQENIRRAEEKIAAQKAKREEADA